jgi:tyrosyl-tRNA synthetase
MAREIQRDYGQPPQAVLTHRMLVGTDGRDKMSKSLGNVVGITDPPDEMYGRVMSVSDSLMLDWFDLLSGGAWQDLAQQRARVAEAAGDPLAFKHELARRVVERFHGADGAAAAAQRFRRVVQRREVPDDVPEQAVPAGDTGQRGLLELLEALQLVPSRSEARRLVAQSAVSVDGTVVRDATLHLAPGSYLLKVGKRRFARVRIG